MNVLLDFAVICVIRVGVLWHVAVVRVVVVLCAVICVAVRFHSAVVCVICVGVLRMVIAGICVHVFRHVAPCQSL